MSIEIDMRKDEWIYDVGIRKYLKDKTTKTKNITAAIDNHVMLR